MQVSFLSLVLMASTCECFVPLKVISSALLEFENLRPRYDFGQVSDTITHEEITRRGLIRSLVHFFYAQPGGQSTIQINNMNRYFNDLSRLYEDYYGRKVVHSELAVIIKTELEAQTAVVDIDLSVKDLPYAHFDAEMFLESNQRVMDFQAQINAALIQSDYVLARKLSGQILHTIQDFYSHSNWVEMGHTQINTAIGTVHMNQQPIIHPLEANACNKNCQLIEVKCSLVLFILKKVFTSFGKNEHLKCPIKYYKCSANVMLNKLISGYYTNQKLPNGQSVVNPGNLMKCNHGGILDTNSFKLEALGGINKDSGVYLFSPHADLHLRAAYLAEMHTEYFFNSIRAQFGDKKFSQFLSIDKFVLA